MERPSGQEARFALIALIAGVALFLIGHAVALPWPAVATRSLAGLFVLAGITRLAGNAGLRGQRYARHAVAGVAFTAALWFAASALAFDRPPLALLALLHVAGGVLAAAREPEAALRERGRLVAAITMNVISLIALAALSGAALPARWLPAVLAGMAGLGAWQITRGRMAGLALAALAGVVSLVLGARILADFVSTAGAAPAARLAPVVAATAALGAVPSVVALGLRLPAVWRVLAPAASPGMRAALAWLTLPAVAAVAVLALAPR